MKLLLGTLLLSTFLGFSQQNFTAIDTTSSSCKVGLNLEYKKKFETINKSIIAKSSKEKTILKEIYSEIQESFLEKIESNDFMCGEDINLYLQELMSEILIKNNIKPEEYKILLSKNSEINAYNTGDGTVVINYGLFLAVENEDELTFVICHEIGHQHLNHMKTEIEAFTRLSTSEDIIAKTKEIRKQKYGKATKATDLMKSIRYQNYSKRRKKEIEADSIGLAFYKKTLRNPKAAINILAKLNDADLESDSLTKDELAYYSTQFNSIELNATFYSMPSWQQVETWKNKTPDNFKFFPKLTNTISHYKRLIDVKEVVDDFCNNISNFDEKLGMAFLQLHDNFKPKDFERLQKMVEEFPKGVPLGIEVRNNEWFEEEKIKNAFCDLLEKHNVANIIVDTAGRRDMLHMRLTSPVAFIRYVGANHPSDVQRLDDWIPRLQKWKEEGLQKLYFFVHQNVEVESPLLAEHFIKKLNKALKTNVPIPNKKPGQSNNLFDMD